MTKPKKDPGNPYQITWEHMEPYEVRYAKADIQEMETLAALVHRKFLDSLSPEQLQMFTAVNGARITQEYFYPEPDLRDVRERCQFVGQHFTLAMVRQQLVEIETILLGHRPGNYGEDSTRIKTAAKDGNAMYEQFARLERDLPPEQWQLFLKKLAAAIVGEFEAGGEGSPFSPLPRSASPDPDLAIVPGNNSNGTERSERNNSV